MRSFLASLACLLALASGEAAQTRRFVLDTPRALAGATGRGVAVFPDGSLRPLAPLETAVVFEEPLGLALAVAPDGTAYVGTGHPARIYRVHEGKKELLGEVKADQITALMLDPEGNLWATTAAPATLVRILRGKATAEPVATLAEGDLWDLAWFKGGLVAAAGNPGRLLRLGGKGFEVAVPIPDHHARCLAVSGELLFIGTSGKGLVLRWDGSGAPGVLYDSGFTEIAALTVSPDGIVYAAGLTGDPTLGRPAKDGGGSNASVTVSVTEGPAAAAPPAAEKGGSATSEIIRILPAGAATVAHRFTKPIADALVWGEQGLVIGTGMEGELWQLVDGAAAQLDAVNATQVVRLASGGSVVLTAGPVKLLQRRGPPHGTFTSPVLDAGQPARWGEAAMRGQLPSEGACTIRFRSGATAQPDETWSVWSAPRPCGSAPASAPPARNLQWQVELRPSTKDSTLRIGRVEVAYRQVNLPPEIKEFTVHEPGEIFLKSPPPSDRVIETQHPDLSGIFTTLDDEGSDRQAALGKKYYRVGYQSLSWKVEDPNGDPLRFKLEVQRAGNDSWWTVRDNLETTVIALDSEALADGMYRFRLTATDAPANPEAPATDQALSSWVVVDNTPPVLTVTRQGDVFVITVDDALSPIAQVEWNRDADRWHPIAADDGVLDSQHERFHIPVAPGTHVLAIRALDDHHNRATVAVEEKP
jgi:hypothetical protein